jgi:AraC family transcriptional regulator
MAAITYGRAEEQGVGSFDRDLLAELIMEASSIFETDRCKAKRCIQRAAELVRDRQLLESAQPGPAAVRGGLSGWQVKEVTAYIESNIGARISIAELAAHVRLSVGHFSRTFRVSFGATPQAYIMRQRILRAEVLMTSSNETLARIALDCGLCDQAHFCRAFRRIVGVSPNVWRRQLRPAARSVTPAPGPLMSRRNALVEVRVENRNGGSVVLGPTGK